jgi:hypothetical protein
MSLLLVKMVSSHSCRPGAHTSVIRAKHAFGVTVRQTCARLVRAVTKVDEAFGLGKSYDETAEPSSKLRPPSV